MTQGDILGNEGTPDHPEDFKRKPCKSPKFTLKQTDEICAESATERNSKRFPLPKYQVVLSVRGNCASAWRDDFPLWLRYLSLHKAKLPFYVWDALFAVWLEDDRIASGRPKGQKREVLEAVAKVLDETTKRGGF